MAIVVGATRHFHVSKAQFSRHGAGHMRVVQNTAEEVLYRLALIARASLLTYMELDTNGQPTISFRNADEARIYALCEVSVEDIVSGPRQGKRTKVKLPDRIAALKLLGQHHGMFGQDLKLNVTQPIPVVLSSAEASL